jgi:hypothetical protein
MRKKIVAALAGATAVAVLAPGVASAEPPGAVAYEGCPGGVGDLIPGPLNPGSAIERARTADGFVIIGDVFSKPYVTIVFGDCD